MRDFIASLISSIPQKGSLTSVEVKEELLTLHVLFTKEVLPALDLLDRGLVSRICTAPGDEESLAEASDRESQYIYYVRSSQQQPSNRHFGPKLRHSNYDSTTHYEVRLSAWTCSCPAFTFSAFPASPPRRDTALRPESSRLGGLTYGDDVPMCKHLLACGLVAWGCAPSGSVETRVVSIEELTGWGAGWGD